MGDLCRPVSQLPPQRRHDPQTECLPVAPGIGVVPICGVEPAELPPRPRRTRRSPPRSLCDRAHGRRLRLPARHQRPCRPRRKGTSPLSGCRQKCRLPGTEEAAHEDHSWLIHFDLSESFRVHEHEERWRTPIPQESTRSSPKRLVLVITGRGRSSEDVDVKPGADDRTRDRGNDVDGEESGAPSPRQSD